MSAACVLWYVHGGVAGPGPRMPPPPAPPPPPPGFREILLPRMLAPTAPGEYLVSWKAQQKEERRSCEGASSKADSPL